MSISGVRSLCGAQNAAVRRRFAQTRAASKMIAFFIVSSVKTFPPIISITAVTTACRRAPARRHRQAAHRSKLIARLWAANVSIEPDPFRKTGFAEFLWKKMFCRKKMASRSAIRS